MQDDVPTFNPRSLYPILGTAMPRSAIDAETRLPDIVVPRSDEDHAGAAFVECRLLVDLLESQVHWGPDVDQHFALGAGGSADPVAPAPVFFVTFNPRARLRIITSQTVTWTRSGSALEVAAIDDARAEVLAIDLGVDLAAHAWRTCAPVAGEERVRLCMEVGFDLSPSGRKQYWPGRELTPIVDYLPHRFVVKLAHARHLLARRRPRT